MRVSVKPQKQELELVSPEQWRNESDLNVEKESSFQMND